MNFRTRHYRLKPDHSVELVEIRNHEELLRWCEEVWGDGDRRRVAFTVVAPGVEVSTVFLGFDHSFSEQGPPILFETMVFTDYGGDDQLLWSTWKQAVAGHDLMVAKHTKLAEELEALRDLPDDQIDTSDIPEVIDPSGFRRDPFLGRIRIRNADKRKKP
jgi:hypothetical protein